jgi:hypothetical protein
MLTVQRVQLAQSFLKKEFVNFGKWSKQNRSGIFGAWTAKKGTDSQDYF